MRANANPSPLRNGKQRLMTSCAIAAGMAALAYGGPALAQVAANPIFVDVGAGTGVNNVGNQTNVNVTQAQSIINWVPTDTAPTGGAIDILPDGSIWNFSGSGDYTVLNRFTSGSGGSLSRQIALNGTVNSVNTAASGARGGNIWFYNAGGILIGATGVINVGSLVLTSNNIITTGGLFGPTGEIRFDGAAGSTSAITVNGSINTNNGINAGNSYVALVAPRIVQAGTVRTDGSVAYVAAEAVDIRINSGLFDINVTRGAEGGNVITHTGTTTGPAHQQGDTDQSRIYMVAIPKNDAVTMLVSGAIGYDDALSAQVDPDGAVRLSAGYNITNGEHNLAPANATAANIVVNDTLFRSNTAAHASGTFRGEALQQLPGSPPPLSSAGRIFVEGNAVFSGDAGATLTVGTGQQGGATGNLTVRSDGAIGAAGSAAVVVSGGTLTTGNLLQITSLAQPATATGDSQGGTASLTVTGGSVISQTIAVSAIAAAEIGTNGTAGTARGGDASISVRNAGSLLSATAVTISASAFGPTNIAVPTGGNAQGGNATLTVADGASFRATSNVSLDANGSGGFGPVQAGNGTGGTGRIEILGANTLFDTLDTSIAVRGNGGSFSGPDTTLNGGDGTGGSAAVVINSGTGAALSLGALSLDASGRGGEASGENSVGGDALGGTASLTADGGATAQFTSIALAASAEAGGALSPGGTTARAGSARGNQVTLSATNGSTINSSGTVGLSATGAVVAGENYGSGTGGNVNISATAGGSVTSSNRFNVDASGGNYSNAIGQSAGNGVGGGVEFLADGGTIRAEVYEVNVSSNTINVSGTGGSAQGGTVDLYANNGGQITATLDATNVFDASARTGISAAGTNATGGTIQLIANAGSINMPVGTILAAGGVSGGATAAGSDISVGSGGTILVRTVADALNSSAISLGDFEASAEGRTRVDEESAPGLPRETSGRGDGGSIDFDIQGGTLNAATINISANGYGGNGAADRSLGTGGVATFQQTGGTINVGDLVVSADGFGGVVQGQSGAGIGGTATIDLLGGTITAADIVATADGEGGEGSFGSDDDPMNIVPGGIGGIGRGGTATINIEGAAVVGASVIEARAAGTGGNGGEFFNFSSFGGTPGTPGAGGDGIGGDATVNVRGGTTTASGMVANASGLGGTGGNSFFSSSSGAATGIGVGGDGGAGRGGTATIALETPIPGVGIANSIALGTGGTGGTHNVGGNGGDGVGGIAQAIVTGFDAGELAVTLDSTGTGGNGANGRDGNGGNGGNGTGGSSRMTADGAGASLTALESNFVSGGTGGNGGAGGLAFAAAPAVAPSGGNGGNGQGGAVEIVANEGGTVTLGFLSGGSIILDSVGRGGIGGGGANGGFFGNSTGGDGGNGGAGTGGTVSLQANGGTITSNGEAVDITVNGILGETGIGGSGTGTGGNGANGAFSGTTGGRVVIETTAGASGPGQIDLGLTSIAANGDTAGRIEIRSGGDISFAGLDAQALGTAAPTNNNTDQALAGIFIAPTGGTISSQGDVTLTTDGSVGIYAQSDGILDVDGALTITAGDQIDIRHDVREGTAATLGANGSLILSAATSISAAPGSLIGAGDLLSLSATGPTATIGVDRLAGGNIVISSAGAASVEHAEAVGDFTATTGSFRTGLNSIITGGNISIASPGAVDLGNSTAGGFVQVSGQSIVFNNIDAGERISLSAEGTATGAEGIRGGSLSAGDDINLFANSVALTGTVTGDASFFAFGTGGTVSVNNADVDGTISIFSEGDMTGTYIAGGDIFLNSDANINVSARANGGYVDANGVATQGNLFVDAIGNAALTDSSAGRMFGVNSGGAATITNGAAGEDLLVRAGTTASLTDVTAGDDLTVTAVGNIFANNASTTGLGNDTHILAYSVGSSSGVFTIGVGEGTAGTNGADIVMASSAGAIDAAALSAGDDILLNAANNIAVNGATTLGLGTTAGDSSIRTQGGATTLSGIDSFSDVIVDATGAANLTGPVAAGRDVAITAASVSLATLTGPGGAVDTLTADGNIAVNSAAGIVGGGTQAFGDLTMTAGTAIDVTHAGGGTNVVLSGASGIDADTVSSSGTTSLDSTAGEIRIGSLNSSGTIDARANAIRIEGGGNMHFTSLNAATGGAYVRGNGDFSVDNGSVAGTADFATSGEAMNIIALTAANANIANSGGFLTLNSVSVTGDLAASARSNLAVTGVVTGQSISLESADIAIGSAGRVGTAGVTQQLSIANNDDGSQTFIGGTASSTGPNGYHIDADELTRVFGTQIEVFAPKVQAAGGLSVGSSAPPDVVVDTFTMTGGASNSNLGANGALTISTPGKMRVIGNVQLTGLTDTNGLNLIADEAIEVILGQGTVRLTGASNAPGGQLTMESDDIIVATPAAIAAVGAATSIDAINARLGENDGVVLDEGALFARGIRANVSGGFYVQNSGAGTDLALRRGLTFGAGGLDVVAQGQPRIVVNGVQLGANGQVTGLEALQLLTINGAAPVVGTYDRRSTFNGCFIASPTACTTVAIDFENNFPVQDIIDEEVDDDDAVGKGNNFPQALITMRDIDPMTGEPLLDDPVTGAGNDDLWTPPQQ
ncbi:hypothetical protein SAMN05428974_3170 [Sphingopyxis sp. YR583]|uniref:hypothetical protein n=1 Tax=Sphingopyxis sp. YR583 TaxID=1881047 RepID=UPI0008A73169|nr:hypothetical protein [Sphingopyxis sp. YR583]SEH19048.1 hypothetical protein SAMN05428974_3170 [Sphingopyxis sp. YR583]